MDGLDNLWAPSSPGRHFHQPPHKVQSCTCTTLHKGEQTLTAYNWYGGGSRVMPTSFLLTLSEFMMSTYYTR